MFLIVSYPRSGNHLVRFFVEYMTGRPTLGCLDNPEDRPISSDTYDRPDVFGHVDQGQPIGHKAHTVREVRRILANNHVSGVIVIWRDPTEAVLAHVDRPRHDLGGLIYRRRLRASVADYRAVLEFYAETKLPKLLLHYEDWISVNPAVFRAELDKIAAFLGPAVIPKRLEEAKADYAELRRLSANPHKRTWKGFRSNAQRRYHQHEAPIGVLSAVKRAVTPLDEALVSLTEGLS